MDDAWSGVAQSASQAAVPEAFVHCPGEYRGEPDDKYIYCQLPPKGDFCTMMKELHSAKDFRRYFLAVIPLILSIFAILLNLLFCAIVAAAMQQSGGGQSSKKRYAFLVSRSISTIIALALFYIVLIAWKLGGFNYFSAAIFLLVGTMGFLTLTGTYLAITSLLYTAVVHPLHYRTYVTMGRCMMIIACIWAISISFSLVVGVLGGTMFYPQSTPIHCGYNTCQFPLAVGIVVVLSICYFLVVFCYLGMLWRMRRRIQNQSRVAPLESVWDVSQTSRSTSATTSSPTNRSRLALERNMRAMNRLSWNLLTFSVSKLPILFISIVALINLDDLRTLGLGQKSACKTFSKGRLFFQVELLASLAAIVWLSGMLFDPAINVLNDPALRAYVNSARGSVRELLVSVPNGNWLTTVRGARRRSNDSGAAEKENRGHMGGATTTYEEF